MPNSSSYKYEWSTGETSSNIYVKKGGIYRVKVSLNDNCSDSASISITELQKPIAYIYISAMGALCKGDSVKLFIVPDNNSWTYKWSTGETTPFIYVTDSGDYSCNITNQEGCTTYSSGHLSGVFHEKPQTKILVSGPTSFCLGDSVTLSAQPVGSGKTYLWNTGETTQQIIVRKGGIYFVKVTLNGMCSGNGTIAINEFSPPKPLIAGDSILCPGRTDILSVLQSYSTYNWSTGETTQSITISQPGTYSVTVSDTNNCKGLASFVVKPWILKLSSLNDVVFNKINIGKEDTQSFSLTNQSDGEINIESISIKGLEGNTFSVTTNPSVPAIFPKGQSISINVSFKPLFDKKYLDSLIISINKPCSETRSIACFGEGVNLTKIGTVVWLPDTTAEIGNPAFRIPLKAKLESGFGLNNLSYTAEIRFDSRYYLPNIITNGTIRKNDVENGERVLNIEGTASNINNNETILTEMIGLAMLGDKESIPLKLTNFIWSDTTLTINKINGSLVVTGVCQQSLSMLKTFTKINIEINPNPAGDEAEITITSEEKGSLNINVYSVQGMKLESKDISLSNLSGSTTVKLNMKDYPTGLYEIVLQTPGEVLTRQIMVVK